MGAGIQACLVLNVCSQIPVQVASRIVEAAQAAGASQLVLVSPLGAGGGGGLFGGFLGGGGSSSAIEQACSSFELSLWMWRRV